MWNDSIRFILEGSEKRDTDGYKVKSPQYTESIPANILDTTRDDEILANQDNYTADLTIEVVACNYTKQKYLVLDSDNIVYEVKRTFKKNKSNYIQLTCQRR